MYKYVFSFQQTISAQKFTDHDDYRKIQKIITIQDETNFRIISLIFNVWKVLNIKNVVKTPVEAIKHVCSCFSVKLFICIKH